MRAALPTALALLLLGAPAAAQEPGEPPAELSRAVADRAIAFFNHPETIRITGESRVPPGREMVGDVAVLGGPFAVAGRVRGALLVLNGDLRLEPGAEVGGDVTVIGGELRGLEHARIAGTVAVHAEPLRFRRERDRIAHALAPPEPSLRAGRQFRFGRADMSLAVRRSYNRVEGLPVAAGPRFQFGRTNPTGIEGLLIYRSADGLGLQPDELGYVLRIEQNLGGRRALRVGATLRSEILPIEEWGISDRENALATFLLHRDYRDYYERDGWGAFVRLAPPAARYQAALEYRAEKHILRPARSPWALFDNEEPWRPQPLVAEGELHALLARVRYDSRNDANDPSSGWYLAAHVEKALGGTLAQRTPVRAPGGSLAFASREANDAFAAALVDARRYARTGPASRLALRALAAGSLDGEALPPQRQHTLGGEGSLPAYRLFASDCGARADAFPAGDDRFFAYYGCDRLVLLQMEYQAAFPVLQQLVGRLVPELDLGETPGWVVFFDAGRAWTEAEARQGRGAGQDDFAADAGLGIRVGRVGLYWARSLSGRGQGTNFFVRIGPRL